MPVITNCPECSRKVRVPDDLLGKKVRCPGCKVVFAAAAVPEEVPEEAPAPPPRRPAPAREERIRQAPPARRAPPPEEDDEAARPRAKAPAGDFQEEQDFEEEEDFEEDELPRGRRGHEDDEEGNEDALPPSGKRSAWRKVATGINYVLISIAVSFGIILFGAVAGGVIGGVTAASAASARGPGGGPPVGAVATGGMGFMALTVLLTLLNLGNAGFRVYAHYLGMAVPDKPGTGLRSLATTTFALFAAWGGLTVLAGITGVVTGVGGAVSAVPMVSAGGGLAVAGLNLLANLCLAVGSIVFILYLRAVATAVKRKDLAKSLKTFLIVSISVGVAMVVMAVLAFLITGAAVFSASAAPGRGPGAAGAAMGGMIGIIGVACVGGLASLGLLIWYVVLLVQVRGAVASYAHRA